MDIFIIEIARDQKRRKNNVCTYICIYIRPQFPPSFFLRIISHCGRAPTGIWSIRIYFLIIQTLCIPEGWNGEGLCRTHESQRPIAVNCVRTRVLCHRKFRFCAGDWFYKESERKHERTTRIYNRTTTAAKGQSLKSMKFLQFLFSFDLNCYKTDC